MLLKNSKTQDKYFVKYPQQKCKYIRVICNADNVTDFFKQKADTLS